MKIKLILIVVVAGISCSSPAATNNALAPQAGTAITSSPSPVTAPSANSTPFTPKDGDYQAAGVVTKLNRDGGSIELNHEEIKDMMPAMQMEFFVSDKKMLDDLKVGDKVEFTLRYKNHTETIVGIKRAQ